MCHQLLDDVQLQNYQAVALGGEWPCSLKKSDCLDFENMVIDVCPGSFQIAYLKVIHELVQNYVFYRTLTLYGLSDLLPSGLNWIDNSFPH